MDKFIIAPFDVLLDKRLNHMQLRVLLALLSFRGKNTNLVWPKRSVLAELVGCSDNNVTKVTGQLVKFGWLKKMGHGGCSRAITYEVLVPDFEVMDIRKKEKTQSPSATLTQSPTDWGIKETIEETIEETKSKEKEEEKEIGGGSRAKTKVFIREGWTPSERCYLLIEKAGIGRAFADELIDEFILYWEDRKEKRPGWDSTFLGNVKRRFESAKKTRVGFSAIRKNTGDDDGNGYEENKSFFEKYGHIEGINPG